MLSLVLTLTLQSAPDAATLAQLERAYDQSCNTRLYGQLDDRCSDMEDRVKAYRRELKRASRSGKGNATPPSPAHAATPQRRAPMSDQAATPDPVPPADAAPDAPSPTGADSTDSLARAFEAVRDAGARDDHAEIAADDAGATRLAEEIGAGSQKP